MPEMVRTAAPRSCMYASAIARGVALICVPSSTVWPGTSTWYTDVDEYATTDGTRRRNASQKGSTEASCIGKVITTARSDAGSGSPAQLSGTVTSNSWRRTTSGSSTPWKYGSFAPTAVPGRLVTRTPSPLSCSRSASRLPTHPAPSTSTSPSAAGGVDAHAETSALRPRSGGRPEQRTAGVAASGARRAARRPSAGTAAGAGDANAAGAAARRVCANGKCALLTPPHGAESIKRQKSNMAFACQQPITAMNGQAMASSCTPRATTRFAGR